MKRSWLIGAALVLSLSAVGCDDDDGSDDDVAPGDSGVDSGTRDSGALDGSIDATVRPDAGDAGDAG